MKKVVPWLVLVLVLFFIVKNPQGAAHVAHRIESWFGQIGRALADFFSALVR